jgi:hypothetical protein
MKFRPFINLNLNGRDLFHQFSFSWRCIFRAGIETESPQGCGGTEQTEDLQWIARPFASTMVNKSTKGYANGARQIMIMKQLRGLAVFGQDLE